MPKAQGLILLSKQCTWLRKEFLLKVGHDHKGFKYQTLQK